MSWCVDPTTGATIKTWTTSVSDLKIRFLDLENQDSKIIITMFVCSENRVWVEHFLQDSSVVEEVSKSLK